MKKILISATHSGAGKTTITLGIMGALAKKGYTVQPFKVGPDYIDTSYHDYITKRRSRNLDSYMLDDDKMKYIMREASAGCDISVIEGTMGLYDGLGSDINSCSTSYVSKVMKAPVILVVDARSMAASAAAMVLGYKNIDPEVELVGVIVNNIKKESHYNTVKESIEKYCGVEVLGYLPPQDSMVIKSRHLGLLPIDENEGIKKFIDELSESIQETVNIDRIFELSESEAVTSSFELSMFTENDEIREMTRGKSVAVAHDRAFNFYYEENLDLLKNIGLEIKYFSPIKDEAVPDSDYIYIGGGFPEIYVEELERNVSMKRSIREKSEQGVAIYAECGGLMYLGRAFIDKNGVEHEMVGALDGTSRMTDSLKRFGYCCATALEDTLISQAGEVIRGHEFHYSVYETDDLPLYEVKKERNDTEGKIWYGGYSKNNTFASYIHTHFYNNLNLVVNLLNYGR